MTGIWVDTDFGFDDLWALLLLRHLDCTVAGVSLVAGNSPLPQVARNAAAAKATYGLDWRVWKGAERPLTRRPETAERILGPNGMRSRELQLSGAGIEEIPDGALEAMRAWLQSKPGASKVVLALGPLTNLAHLLKSWPDLAGRITRLVWMGGSSGPGNHTPLAEYNAVADAEALAAVLASGVHLDIVDLVFCRSVTFGENDLPETDHLTRDLLGGYLDIALERGRSAMGIYDPLAAIAAARPDLIGFAPCTAVVSTDPDETYGATGFLATRRSRTRLASVAKGNLKGLCLAAVEGQYARV